MRCCSRPLLIGVLGASTLAGGVPATAGAAPPARTLSASGVQTRSCHGAMLRANRSVRTLRSARSPGGLVRVMLSARGDWDLAVFDAASGRFVAAGAGPGGRELAEGYVAAGRRLHVQACRRPGAGASARLRLRTIALARDAAAGREQVVRVHTPTGADRSRLQALGLDPAESGRPGAVDVVLHGRRDARALAAAGLRWTVTISDLAARDRAGRSAERRYSKRTAASSLPSARDGYRHLADYEAELRSLAQAHPGLVRLITLPQRSLEGREVLGVEIARNVNVAGGQPVMLQLGGHHAREWPSSELPMEWARELISGYGKRDRITRLVDRTRTIVVPVVNPDGFNLSREWPVDIVTPLDQAGQNGLLAEEGVPPAPGAGFQFKRRNCRVRDGLVPAPAECGSLANRRRGVDLNRNYGGSWGGPGASLKLEDDTYRGAAPFSEPEVSNVRQLISSHQVTTLISNHTFGNLILRPPGITAAPKPRDDALLRSLGDAMAERNGYESMPGYALYDAGGTTEDWSYNATGGLGYTFEVGADSFHPPFASVVDQYARNRDAYYVALESTANRARHAVATGTARRGSVIRAHKEFSTPTAPVIVDELSGATSAPHGFRDVLDSTISVGRSGRFTWHLNPSTRPASRTAEAWKMTCERPLGTVRARGRLVIKRGRRRSLRVCNVPVSLKVRRRTLGTALRRGLRAQARCPQRCGLTATVTIPGSVARRHGLTRRRGGRVAIARAGRRTFAGRRTVALVFTGPARTKLGAARRLRVRVSVVARGGVLAAGRVQRTLTLRR